MFWIWFLLATSQCALLYILARRGESMLGILIGCTLVEIGSLSLGTGLSYPLLFASSIGSIVFSAVIGIAGGLYPAVQASRMDVVTALRFE